MKSVIALDKVLLTGGTTYQGRGYYYNVMATLAAWGVHGVMVEVKDDNSKSGCVPPDISR